MSTGHASYATPELLARRRAVAAEHRIVSGPPPRTAQERIAELCPRGTETVVDVGCGAGDYARLVVPRIPRGRYVGVDLSPGMLAACVAAAGLPRREDDRQERPTVAIVRARAERLPLRDRSADVVLCCFLLFFLDESELEAALDEAVRVLRPGGRLIANAYGERSTTVDLPGQALDRVAPGATLRRWHPAWRIETAEGHLDRRFRRVSLESIAARYVFTGGDGDDLADYVLSFRGELLDRLPEGVDPERFLEALEAVAREAVARSTYVETTPMAWLTAVGPGR